MPNEEKLKALKKIQTRLNGLSHRKKSDGAYWEAREIGSDLYAEMTTNDFRLDKGILDKYAMRGSDKRKEEVIEEFKRESLYDLHTIIAALERNESAG